MLAVVLHFEVFRQFRCQPKLFSCICHYYTIWYNNIYIRLGAWSMEREIKCKVIEAVFGLEKGVLGGPIDISCDIKDTLCFHLTIKHNIKRYITITVDNEVSVFDLYSVLTKVERLLMIFYGYFVPLEELTFLQSSVFSDEQLKIPANNLKASRLSYP